MGMIMGDGRPAYARFLFVVTLLVGLLLLLLLLSLPRGYDVVLTLVDAPPSSGDRPFTSVVARLGKRLGEGFWSEVFLAKIEGCDESPWIAVKKFKSREHFDMKRDCARQVEALATFNHFPDFVHTLGHTLPGSQRMFRSVCMIAMQVADGDLTSWSPTWGGSPSDWDLAVQLASAVSRIHEAGYAHRDIKPENILMSRARGHILIGDLGSLCNLVERPGSGLETCGPDTGGDRHWWSPEYRKMAAKDEVAHDLWSLGLSLCAAVSEDRAGEPHDQAVSKTRCSQGNRKIAKDEVRHLIDLLLDADPENRKAGFKSWVEKHRAEINSYEESLRREPAFQVLGNCSAQETSRGTLLRLGTF